MNAGSIRRQPVKPLAQVLLAALGGAGRLIANSDDPAATRQEMERALMGLFSSGFHRVGQKPAKIGSPPSPPNLAPSSSSRRRTGFESYWSI